MNSGKLYINGTWRDATGRESIDVVNPATEAKFGAVPQATAADIDDAVRAAQRALPQWSATPVAERIAYLGAIAQGLKRRGSELAKLITQEMGMPSSMSYGYQVEPPIAVLESFIEVLGRFSFIRNNDTSFNVLEPVGVCALITPWNFPLTQTVLKLAPALGAGCTTILKPSEYTPLSATVLAEIIDEAGLPPGVFNLIHGRGPTAGHALATHDGVDLISLTGSTRAGKSVAASAADTLKRVTLELGGKSPNIICDDADFSVVIPAGVNKCFSNSGQACDAPTRMLVPQGRYSEALELAKAAAESLVIGNPEDESVQLGPLVNAAQYQRVTQMIGAGIDEGARVVTGGLGRPQGLARGYYIKPTVFGDVNNGMKIAQQEIFGPVLCVIPYRDDDEAVRIANDTPYGLAAFISCADESRAAAIARRLRVGQVRVNAGGFDITAPFGGVKMSGYGRELGELGVEEFLEVKACMGLARETFTLSRKRS